MNTDSFLGLALAIIAIGLVLGCGGSSSPASPGTGNTDLSQTFAVSDSGNRQLWGAWHCFMVPGSGAINVVPLRTAAFTANVNNLLEEQQGNLQISDMDLTDFESEGLLPCTVTLTHPLAGMDQFHGFDVWGAFLHNGASALGYDGLTYSGGPNAGENEAILQNPDGFTRWFNYPEFDGDILPIFEFWPGKLSNLPDPTATLNAYKVFADGLGTEDSYYEWATTPGNLDDRGIYRAGQAHSRRYELHFPIIDDEPVVDFQYAVIASWEPGDPTLTGQPAAYDPFDFPTSANCEEPFLLSVSTVASDLYYVDETELGGTFFADVEVFDWQGGSVGGNGIPNEVESIIIEGDFLPGGSYQWSQSELATVAISATENSSVFQIELVDCTPTSSVETEIWVIVEAAGQSGATYDQDFGTEYPEGARRAAFIPGSVAVSDEAPAPPEPEWSDPVLIDTNSHMPRAIVNAADETVLIWHKESQGIQYGIDNGTGWSTPEQAYNTNPSFMHILAGQAGQTVYASYKGWGQGGYERHALRWTGGSGAWDYMWLWGWTGQPSILLPDDDGSFAHIYTFMGGFQIIGFNSWGSGWSGMTYADGVDVRMASTNFHERDDYNHLVAYHRSGGGVNWARFVRISKSTIYTHPTCTIYQGAAGELVDAPGLCRDTSGNLHAAWRVVDGSDYRVDYASSADGGVNWSSPVTIVDAEWQVLENYVGIDADSTGRILVTYTHGPYIYMIYSDDGVAWGEPTSFYDEPELPTGYHYTQPFPLVTSDDVLHLFYVFKDSIFVYGQLYEITWPA